MGPLLKSHAIFLLYPISDTSPLPVDAQRVEIEPATWLSSYCIMRGREFNSKPGVAG